MKSSHSPRRRRATVNEHEKQPRAWILALMLTGALALEAYPSLLKSAFVQAKAVVSKSLTVAHQSPDSPIPMSQLFLDAPQNLATVPSISPTYRVLPNPLFKHKGQLPKATPVNFKTTGLQSQLLNLSSDAVNLLPPQIKTAIRQRLLKESQIAANLFKIVGVSQHTWRDTCLGLAKDDEFCGELLVKGWRVVASDGQSTWVYRTDSQGKIIRLESQNHASNLPESVAQGVLQAVTKQSGLASSRLKLETVEEQLWPNGCLGLTEPGMFCTQALVTGWRVMVVSDQERWVYRTNNTGSTILFDQSASSVQTPYRLQFLTFPGGELLSPWTKTVVARLHLSITNFKVN